MSDREDKPSEVKREADDQQIALRVVNGEGVEVFFKIRRQVPMGKLIDAYCKKQGLDRNSVRFLYDGNAVDPDKTPEELEMEDEDIIDAMLEQIGGF